MKALTEDEVFGLSERGRGGAEVVDLRHYEGNEELKATLDLEACWVTWSMPFDVEEDMTSVATAYMLSPAVKKYGEDQYDGKVLWYGTTLEEIADYLEALEANAPQGKAAPKPVTQGPDTMVSSIMRQVIHVEVRHRQAPRRR
ncbi:MAG: hypothetical protein J6386_12540 [Candidatus Synoicihabitans palmerolidicus]|nr:hypothetical protein [Candidatus Synoicihabitans palmerolidicus]